MREDWEVQIGDIVQYPYAYCKHTQDKDSKSEHRKDHVHIILAFPNTTTYKHAMSVFNLLSAEGKKALNKVEAVIGIRNVYDYLIHDTETCKKQGKELYDPAERITGNNFDIGAYEQLGTAEKNEMFLEMGEAIREHGFTNYMDFYEFVVDTYDDMNYIEVMRAHSGHFERLTKGNYQRWEQSQRGLRPSQGQQPENHESTTEQPPFCCPRCGSISVKKNGKTLANRQKWACKDCGKSFL
jgi:predicted RNA-binding Zn-ribbon protein involved in translation (DUF1610 family)